MTGKQITILLIDSSSEFLGFYRKILDKNDNYSFRIEHTENISKGLETILKGKIDLVLLDFLLPDYTSKVDALIRLHAHAPSIPVIVLADPKYEPYAIKALNQGAQDYLIKGHIDHKLLVRSIRYALKNKRLENKNQQLENLVKERSNKLIEADKQLQEKLFIDKWAEEKLVDLKSFYRKILDGIINGVWVSDRNDVIYYINKGMAKIAGMPSEQILGACVLKDFPEDTVKFFRPYYQKAKQTLKPVYYKETPVVTPAGRPSFQSGWLIPQIKEDSFNGMICTVEEVTERKQALEKLERIEWLLKKTVNHENKSLKLSPPSYGDLAELNKTRFIMNAVGKDILSNIVGDYLDLLDTSGAIYEENGDYALGIFASGWCRFLDQASRDLCQAQNNAEALSSGKWLCHESCWHDASKSSIEKDQPVDIECHGGIHIYAVPVRAFGKIVGSMNFGYGDPPQEQAKLQEIAKKYAVSVEKLQHLAQQYESRPQFIIDIAKKRLQSSALLIGEIVERKYTEDALQQEKNFNESLLETAQTIVLVLDTKGRIKYFNPYMEQISGYKLDEVKDKDWFSTFLPQEDHVRIRKIFLQAVNDIQTRGNVNPIITKKGNERLIEWYDKTLKDINGRVTGLITVGQDITERKQAEEELAEHRQHLEDLVKKRTAELIEVNAALTQEIKERKWIEELLSYEKNNFVSILNSMEDGVYIVNDQYDIEYANPALQKEFGSPEGKKCYQYLNDRNAVCPLCKNPEVFTGKTIHWEWYCKKNNKTYDLVDTPLKNPDGSISKLELFRDISEHKQIEENLRFKSKIVTKMSEGINLVRTSDRIIVYTNPKFDEMFGYAPDELLGKHISIVNAPDDKTPKETTKIIVKAVEKQGFWRGELRGVKKDGTTFWSSASISKFNHPQYGEVFITLQQDITERKKAEEMLKARQREIEELNATLETRVKEELEKNIQKDTVMMQQARLAAMGEMIGHIAHQWRQPLNALNLILYNIQDLLENDMLEPEMTEELTSKGKKLITKMSTTIDDFRNFFKPSKEKGIFSVNNIIKSSLALLDPSFKHNNISVRLNESKQINTLGIANEYSQAILNILNNAKDAILDRETAGKIIIDIFEENENAILSIKDNGGGIPDDLFDKIFEPYFTSKHSLNGTGIGLSLSKQIIEKHMGGSISVQNIDDGAEFKVITKVA